MVSLSDVIAKKKCMLVATHTQVKEFTFWNLIIHIHYGDLKLSTTGCIIPVEDPNNFWQILASSAIFVCS